MPCEAHPARGSGRVRTGNPQAQVAFVAYRDRPLGRRSVRGGGPPAPVCCFGHPGCRR